MSKQQPLLNPLAQSEVARITISLHDNGGVSVAGNIGDVKLATQMIDAARDAVATQLAKRGPVIVPGHVAGVPHDAARFPFGQVPT
jgi:hypothetical protein